MTKKVKNEWCICCDVDIIPETEEITLSIVMEYDMEHEDPGEFKDWECGNGDVFGCEDFHLDVRILEYEDGTIEIRGLD